jgi:hypothetical protein
VEPKQYSAVIAKVLKDVGFKDPSGLTKVLIAKMETLDELLGDGAVTLGDSSLLEVNPKPQPFASRRQEEPALDLSKGLLIGTSAMEEIDIFKPVAQPAAERVMSDAEIMQIKSKCIEKFKQNLPAKIMCQPPGFDQPLQLTCKSYASSPGPMPVFKIIYSPSGVGDGGEVFHVVNIYEPVPSAQEVIDSLTLQAEGLYRSKPTSAPPPIQSPALTLGAMGAAFNPMDADSPQRPVENIGDGLTVDEMKYFKK